MDKCRLRVVKQVFGICSLLFSISFVSQISKLSAFDVILEKTENIPGETTTEIDFNDWKFNRVKKSFLISGQMVQHVDMDNSYKRSMDLEYKHRLGENYVKSPIKIPQMNVCDFYNTTYKNYLMSSFEGHSNFPVIPPEGLCPIPKGTYFVNNVTFDASLVPKSIPSGFWKIEEIFYKNQESIGGLRVFLRVVK